MCLHNNSSEQCLNATSLSIASKWRMITIFSSGTPLFGHCEVRTRYSMSACLVHESDSG